MLLFGMQGHGKGSGPAKKEGAGWWERVAVVVTLYGDVLPRRLVRIAVEGMEGVKSMLGEEKRMIPSKEMKLLGAVDSGRDNK